MTGVTEFQITDGVPRTSLALEASAGTGKTWTLTSLAVRYVAEGEVELPDLLLVTFTRAATAELRERVRRRLAEATTAVQAAIANPDHTPDDPVLRTIVQQARERDDDGTELRARRDRLRRAAQHLDDATISTIHGFCQRMLQHAALEAGVDFDAVLLDDDADLIAEIVDDHLARELRSAPPAWVRYLQDVGKVNRGSLTTLARTVSGMPALHLQPDVSAIEGPPWLAWTDALERFRRTWQDGGRDQAAGLIPQMKADGAFTKGQRTFTEKIAAERVVDIDTWLEADRPVPPGPVKRSSPHRVPGYPMSFFTAAALTTKLAEGAVVPDLEVLDASARLIDAAVLPATLFRHRAATWMWAELDRRKRQRTVLTYDDLLRRLADALDRPATRDAVRESIRQRYRVALIDEFQDTDPVQWRIFNALFDTREPFILIGDPKQAIYAFRGADVHTYVAARDSRPDTQTLQTNHRSDRSFVDACNTLFDLDRSLRHARHPVPPHHGAPPRPAGGPVRRGCPAGPLPGA
jgi:exodeoxyribonuclease V beta subunit